MPHGACSVVYTFVYFLVRFSWDARKSNANLAQRGFDFAFASLIFDGPTLERVDDRETIRSIISARRSNRRERSAYDEAFEQEA